MIAEDAASDSKAIQTLSSLNKTWYTTIQPILYRRISIEGTRHEKYRDFETLIQARPEVATWLQELSFLFGFCCPHPRGLLYNGYMCDFMDNMPEKLVNLRSIELVESMTLTGDQEESYDLRRCLAEFHSVRELRFYMGLVDQNMLKILTYAFPNLRVLEVSRCIVSPRINQDERFSRGTAIQRLEFYDSLSNEREFLSWLGEANKKDELKSIALSTNDRDAVRTIGSFIRKYGGSLEELELLLLTPELKGKERFEAGKPDHFAGHYICSNESCSFRLPEIYRPVIMPQLADDPSPRCRKSKRTQCPETTSQSRCS